MPTRLSDLPDDILWKIYRTFFSVFVVPCIPEHTTHVLGLGGNSELSLLRGRVQSALSRANMYTKGRLDVTQLSAEDRQYVYWELRQSNVQIHAARGKLYFTTCVPHELNKYNDPEHNCFAVFTKCQKLGRYAIQYQNHLYDLKNPNVCHIDNEVHEETAGWFTPNGQ